MRWRQTGAPQRNKVRFDIDNVVNRLGITRKMIGAAVQDRRLRSRTAERNRRPGPDVPLLTPDEIPDFEVVIVLEKLGGNKHEARLCWFLFGNSGEFPVIPVSEQSAELKRTSTMAPHQFNNARDATIEAAKQAGALTDNFIEWATKGDPDAI
jgi:hypothetical protein